MRILRVGQLMFASAIAGLGVLSLAAGDFAGAWRPGRAPFAHANGVLMLALGIGPIVVAAPLLPMHRSGLVETETMTVSGLVPVARLSTGHMPVLPDLMAGKVGIRNVTVIFALAVFLMGLAYLGANADFPLGWISHRYDCDHLVGAAYVATGLGILSGTCARPPTCATAVMMSLVMMLYWLSFVAQAPVDRLNWTGLLSALALSGAAWMVAESHGAHAWLDISRTESGRFATVVSHDAT